ETPAMYGFGTQPPNRPQPLSLEECKAILSASATSTSTSTSGTVSDAVSTMRQGMEFGGYNGGVANPNGAHPESYSIRICRDPVLLGYVVALLDPQTCTPPLEAETVKATLSLLSTLDYSVRQCSRWWRVYIVYTVQTVQPVVEAGLLTHMPGLVSADELVADSLQLLVATLDSHPPLAVSTLHTALFPAVLAADLAINGSSVSDVVHCVLIGLLSRGEDGGERETAEEDELSEADYRAIKTGLPALGVVSRVPSYGGLNAITALLTYSEIRCGEHSGLLDIADAGLVPTLLGAREAFGRSIDPEVAASLDYLTSRLKANPDLIQYIPPVQMVIERTTYLSVARPFHTFDCVKTPSLSL
ncbi:hypothetical protein KIPB_008200, partial [Kipferlia bialata]